MEEEVRILYVSADSCHRPAGDRGNGQGSGQLDGEQSRETVVSGYVITAETDRGRRSAWSIWHRKRAQMSCRKLKQVDIILQKRSNAATSTDYSVHGLSAGGRTIPHGTDRCGLILLNVVQ